jgi:hypothetical protein
LLLTTDNEGWTVFHRAAYAHKIEVFQGIFNFAKENLTTEKLKN